MIKKLGFTLTEIMIAMGVIGIVSAITIPALVNNYTNRANTVQFRKFMEEFSSSLDMYITEEGKTKLAHTGIFDSMANAENFINNKFKVVRTCEARTGGCFAGTYGNLNGGSSGFTCNNKSFVLSNSTAICIDNFDNLEDGGEITFQIDINGTDKPNIGGRDMFLVDLRNRDNTESFEFRSGNANSCLGSTIGNGCYTRLVENNWNMNY